ncbi:hypothetical protein Bca52824_001518 [Brassica carinata]|uniref:Replication protein A 70 kDa DNA-binding subunit B/D first OB fold domain-containing protein n=1 Tax=Brassica carinata TaxID=52824 RepID=A0A8X8BDF5_BRACI|nr:hypothetical protein Bca52824_001518 [Brassica carinata]
MALVRASKNIVSPVRDLKPRKDMSRIEVRIIRLWRNYNKESGNTIEMVFVDKEGIRIHASFGEQLIKKYGDKLHEGDAIVVQLFKVYDTIGEYSTTSHPYKIGFYPTTYIGKAAEFPSEVPEKYFADFTDIMEGNIDSSCLIGTYSISSGFNSTHILLHPTLELIDEFKACLPDDSLAITNNDSSQWSVGIATSVRARFFVLNERLTIREIIDSTLVTLELSYDSGEANFLLFDANAQAIVRRSAAELYNEYEDEELLPEAVTDLFGKRILFEISVDADNIKGKSSLYVVRIATADREMIEEFAALPPKPVLMLQSSDDISSGSGGVSGTPLSKRKSKDGEESSREDQHSVNKQLAQKKVKGE